MSTEKSLTIEAIIELWENRFLPSIRNEIKAELSELRSEVNVLTAKCKDIETSQQFLSNEFDNFKKIMHDNKKQTADLSKKVNIVETRIEKAEESNYAANVALDNLEQYGRRECIEISGIPTLPIDNPKQLTVELGHLMGVEITQEHISTAHRLPSTRKVKERFIVKFVHRDTKDEFYKKRSKLAGKKSKNLPSVANEFGKSIHRAENIFISESLTPYRKKLFGRINEFKKNNQWKYLWTVNGKILLRQSEHSQVFGFTTEEEFEEFLQGS
jgi:chromosome segregation ATPase